MDIKEAKILWNRGGPVKVVSMSKNETAQEKALHGSYGACDAEWVEAADDNERLLLLLSQFVRLAVLYGIAPDDVNKAFLEIDQYREHVGPELAD
jgi:hypothetical protein